MIGHVAHDYQRFLGQCIYQTHFQYGPKVNAFPVESILREISDFKKRFSFSTNCFFCIEYYLRANQKYFFVKHFELLLQAHEPVFDLMSRLLDDRLDIG